MTDPAAILAAPQTFPRVHMMGIGGIGMAGLARLLKANGFAVTGCDLEASRRTADLEQSRIPVAIGHSPDHLSADWLIYSPAVPPTHPERLAAEERGIPAFRRGEILPALARRYDTTAVAGTHGKTTTASMLLHIHRNAALGASWCIGGEVAPDGRPGGAAGPRLIIEADESDGTLPYYHPRTAVLTNIEPDHMEHFHSHTDLLQNFRRFLQQSRHRVICADDPAAADLAKSFPDAFQYGLQNPAAMTHSATGIHTTPAGLDYTLLHKGRPVSHFHLPLPGLHNLANALAAITAARLSGIPPESAARALHTFTLPRRRFERLARKNGITLIGDYAHHPGEIRALLAAARQTAPTRILAVFQPHRYTRTHALAAGFSPAFTGADHVLLLPVYPASESPIPGGTSADLAQRWRQTPDAPPLEEIPDFPAAVDRLTTLWQPGDLILLIGAGDIETLGPRLAARL